MNEVWKPISGHPGYEVSNLGRVRSIDRDIVLHRKKGLRIWRFKGKILSPTCASHGYPTVKLKNRGECVHILVLRAFVGAPPESHECCHQDGDKTNAKLENLSWGTSAQNSADTKRHGRHMYGERFPQAVLSDDKVRGIRNSSLSSRQIAQQLGVNAETVRQARIGKTWAHVTPLTNQGQEK